MVDPTTLARALAQRPPREARLLLAVTGRPPAGPEWYGVSPEAFAQSVAAAAEALGHAAGVPAEACLATLRGAHGEVAAALAAAQAALASSPEAQRRQRLLTWGFRGLVAVAATLYLVNEGPAAWAWLSSRLGPVGR